MATRKTLTVKQQVRDFLKSKGMTQIELSDRLGISQSHLSQILNGKTPSLPVAVALEDVTGIAPRHFVGAA